MRILAKHPVRERVAGIETYHETAGGAARVIDDILNEHGMELDFTGHCGITGDEGRITYPIRAVEGAGIICGKCDAPADEFDNVVCMSWYKMGSGRYEITAYIS